MRTLVNYLPSDVEERYYREPFVGAASLFLHMRPAEAAISDANQHLIDCYQYVSENPHRVADLLRTHIGKTCEKYYYEIREEYNRSRSSATQAARFIYLNRTCFNGIFRVNMQDQFNVPYGWKEPPPAPTRDDLIHAGKALEMADLSCDSYEHVLDDAISGDFVYLDPPYPPLNGTSYFTHYTATRFGDRDQEKLAETVAELDRRGCLVMMSNADTPRIRELYKRFQKTKISATRFVTSGSKKHKVSELVITNYEWSEEQ